MKVFVACERSGVVRRAFAAKGHDAWSCDIEAADDGHPNHFQTDALVALAAFKPDLLIAHPPCTGIGCLWGLGFSRRLGGGR